MYGTKQTFMTNSFRRYVKSKSGTLYNDVTKTYANAFFKEGVSSFTRSGNNSAVVGKQKTVSRKPVLVTRTVPGGWKLPYKIWHPRLKRYIWARKPVTVYRIKMVKSKAALATKGLDIMPNPLTYSGVKILKVYGPKELTAVQSSSGWSRNLSGDLWSNIEELTSGTLIQPNPQSYVTSPVSQFIQDAQVEADRVALAEFYERCKNQDVNLAQALAERTQTAAMFSDIVVRAASAVAAAKRGNLSKAAKIILPNSPRGVANDWLMYQYGVKPLLSDLDGAMKQLAAPEPLKFDTIASHTVKVPSRLLYSATTTQGVSLRTEVWSSGEVTVKYKGRFKVDVIPRDLSRLGFGNLASLAWEVLPYSFVADWFIPIGDYLNNQDAFAGLGRVFSHRTVTFKERIQFIRVFGGVDDGYYNWPSAQAGLEIEKISVNRVITNSVPPLGFPSFKDPVSVGHIANAVALLVQLSSKR